MMMKAPSIYTVVCLLKFAAWLTIDNLGVLGFMLMTCAYLVGDTAMTAKTNRSARVVGVALDYAVGAIFVSIYALGFSLR